jgi:serine protease
MTISRLVTLIFVLAGVSAFAQTGSETSTSVKGKIKYEPQTLIIKFKSPDQLKFQKIDQIIPLIKKSALQAQTVLKMFETAQSPAKLKNNLGQQLADLSRTYIIRYSAPFQVEYAAELIQKTGLVEYAEPYYYHDILVMPNDPSVVNGKDQFYLERVKAYDAWNLTKGDSSVVIGIIDTGVRTSHEDLKNNLKYNIKERDGLPNVDDDQDGYVDNIAGWDLGNNDNNPDATGSEHGTAVASIAAAVTDNGKGMAGVGFKCKYMPVKASNDARPTTISYGYEALYYAASHGCKVVNLSFGGPGIYSRTAQDIVTYAAVNKDVAIIAAAGNSNKEEIYYPASYKYVISVAAADTITSPVTKQVLDKKADLATYSYEVDLCAQGKRVYFANNSGGYGLGPGSSFASPIVAGAAGLVRSYHPDMNALQVMEQLRISGDIVDTFPETRQYKEKYGRRLNIFRALTDTLLPSVRVDQFSAGNSTGNLAAGDTVKISMTFINYLYHTSACRATLRSLSPFVKLTDSTTQLGAIPTLGTRTNTDDPFAAIIDPAIPANHQVTFRVQFDDGRYYDYQYINHIFNPAFLGLTTSEVKLTIGSTGIFENNERSPIAGQGFVYKNNYLLYEGGLMIGLNDSTVSDCVRGDNPDLPDMDFRSLKSPEFVKPAYSDQQITNSFSDMTTSRPIGVSVEQNSFSWQTAGDSKYLIVEYRITNKSGKKIDSLHAGIFADWDIQTSNKNKAYWNEQYKLGFVYSIDPSPIYAGIALLTPDKPTYYAMDHISSIPDNIYPNDSFTTLEKFLTMKNGVSKTVAGAAGSGTDVSHVVGAKISGIEAGETRKVAFAIMAGNNLTALFNASTLALAKYKSFNTGPAPDIRQILLCNGKPADTTLVPEKGKKFNLYNSNGLIEAGKSSFRLKDMTESDTLYISNIDSVFESSKSPLYLTFGSAAKAEFSFSPAPLNLYENSTVTFTNKSSSAVSSFWNFGDTGNSASENPEHIYTATGKYQVKLQVKDANGCIAEKSDTVSVIYSIPTGPAEAYTESIKIFPVPAGDYLYIEAADTRDLLNVSLVNSLGGEIKNIHKFTDGGKLVIDLRNQPPGFYFVDLIYKTGKVSKSFVKK